VTAGLFTSSTPGSPVDLQFYVGRGLAQPDPFVTITVSPVRVASRGSVTLRSADPEAPPAIRMHYLQAQGDVDVLVRGLRLARALGLSPAYEALRGEEIAPGAGVTSDTDIARYGRAAAESIYHPAGSCRMGPASDAEAVVDPELRVRGVDGLRLADASIMPEVVNAPTHAACVMIGERCASLIADGAGSAA
jgi:choline dehydrogenase